MEPTPSTPETPTRLVLVRHGESNSTVSRIVGGHEGCTGLSPHGRLQAEALRERLARTKELADASVILTSILPRAIETAQIIAPALGGLVATERCELCEIHPGEADGIGWEEFEERYRPLGSLNSNPYRIYAPGSESWAVFFARVGQALMQAADEHRGQTAVVVCHGGVIEGSLAALGQIPLQRGFDLEVHNTSITEWILPAEADRFGRPPRWRLARFNDAAHLLDE